MTIDDSEGDINVSLNRAKWQQRHLNEGTQRILEEDARYFMHQVLSTPCLNVLAGNRAIGHFTREKSPVAYAAGNADLDSIENDSLIQHAVTQGDRLTNGLKNLVEKHGRAVSVRGKGLIVALKPDASTSQFADRLLYRCLELGLNFKTSAGRYVILTPPLTVSDEEVDEAITILDTALADVSGEFT